MTQVAERMVFVSIKLLESEIRPLRLEFSTKKALKITLIFHIRIVMRDVQAMSVGVRRRGYLIKSPSWSSMNWPAERVFLGKYTTRKTSRKG